MNRSKSAVALASALSLSLLAACNGGVSTSAAGASPTPSHTSTPGSTPTVTPPDATPTPTATGTPSAETMQCSFVWSTSYVAIDGTYDFYEVDVAGSKWANTTNAFLADMSVSGYYIIGYNPTAQTILAAGMSIDGAIALNVSNTAMGTAAGFTDTASHTFYDATDYFNGVSTQLGGAVATGGTGNFAGNLSNPDATTAVTPGTGSIDATDGTTTETFGGPNDGTNLDYAVCSPVTP